MSGLRETKKQATRQALADAAARIVLTEGYDALSVAAVAGAAEVSPRTFHNYFSSLDEALLEFMRVTFAALAEDIRALPAHMDLLDIFQELAERGFDDTDAQLHSVASLFTMGELIENRRISASDPECALDSKDIAGPVFMAFSERLPGRDEFEVTVILQSVAAAVIHSVRTFQRLAAANEGLDPEQGRAWVRRAITILRNFPAHVAAAQPPTTSN